MTESFISETAPTDQEDTEREKDILAELEATMPPLDLTSESPDQRAEREARRQALLASLTPEELRVLDEASRTYGQEPAEIS